MNPIHFKSAAGFRRWLEANHATADEALLGFFKQASGKGGLTYPQAVDELLCFGWIDGVKRRVDDERYTHRISPRRPVSHWSNVNVAHVARLTKAGKMHPAGLRAFAARRPDKTGTASYEQRPRSFPAAFGKIFQKNKAAWTFWQSQPPGYQRTLIFWVTSAKQQATKKGRLQKLIAASAANRRLF